MRREKLTKGKIRAKVLLWSIAIAMAAAAEMKVPAPRPGAL